MYKEISNIENRFWIQPEWKTQMSNNNNNNNNNRRRRNLGYAVIERNLLITYKWIQQTGLNWIKDEAWLDGKDIPLKIVQDVKKIDHIGKWYAILFDAQHDWLISNDTFMKETVIPIVVESLDRFPRRDCVNWGWKD